MIRSSRVGRGLSQAQLADLLQVHQQAVHRWEKGSEPDRTLLPRIIEVLGLDRDEVMRGLGYGELFRDEPESVGPKGDSELRFKRPPGLTDRQWSKVKAEHKAHLDYLVERASRER